MGDNFIQLPSDSSGKKVRTKNYTIGGQDVHDEIVEMAKSDGTIIDPPTSAQLPSSLSSAGNLKTEEQLKASTPAVYNVTMTNGDTEYSQALPANCKKFLIHTRDESEFRLAFVTGKVAAPTAPYFTVLAGSMYWEEDIRVGSLTLYFASDYAGKIIEIIAWS